MSPVSWFNGLLIPKQQEHYSWLADLPQPIDHIANFGCWSGCEPFALLWTLDAREITVVEKEENYLSDFYEQMEILSIKHPQSLQGRTVDALCKDMIMPIHELQDQYYDLA